MSSSQPDLHFLATAVHGAKSCGLDEAQPDLVQEAERKLEEAHRGASQAELRESLRAATSVVSARLNTQDPMLGEETARLRSVLTEARDVGFSPAELVQAEQTLFKASQFQQEQAAQVAADSVPQTSPFAARQATPAASPKPSLQASPARVPASPAASPAASLVASPAALPAPTSPSVPEAEQKAMQDKVSKLLQTLLAGGSAPESLRKAAEVAAAAGLAPEICAYARTAAESRSIAHEKAVAALASGSLDAIRQAKIDVELAGGPNSDLRQLVQVLEMQRAPSSSPALGPAGFRPQLDVAEMRQREEQLLKRLREARGRDLDELRRELSPPGTRQWGGVPFSAPALSQYPPDTRRVQQPRRHVDTFQEAPPRREVRTEPDMRKAPAGDFPGAGPAPRPPVAQSGGVLGETDQRWLNPFGLDEAKQAFDPMGLPPSDYKSMLTNARRLMQTPGRPFESPDFWRADGRVPSVLHV